MQRKSLSFLGSFTETHYIYIMIISITGLGYVGLPLALALAKHYHVIGFDTDERHIELLRSSIDMRGEMTASDFANTDIKFTSDENMVANADFHIIAVPTPIDVDNKPDLSILFEAVAMVAKHIKHGDTMVIESSVYPGCTDDECVPIIEEASGLLVNENFGIGYSPERINPGDQEHSLANVIKIISAGTAETLDLIEEVYSHAVPAGLFRAANIRVAEAAKLIENTQRDVNIALMNELSVICSHIGISTCDVISAASTKWNFVNYSPGLVGGHCIGVDPYYLDYKAAAVGCPTHLVSAGRKVNNAMGRHVAQQTVKRLAAQGKNIVGSRVLVLGATYKPDVCDIRNTRSADIVRELLDFRIKTTLVDPRVKSECMLREYNIPITTEPEGHYDAIILAVPHQEFLAQGAEYYKQYLAANAVFCDIKGVWRGEITNCDYWTL